jgi:uncharacterized protein
MQLWSGAYSEFQDGVANGTLFPHIERAFRARYGCLPGDAEQRSWRESLSAVQGAVAVDHPEDVALAVEYHLPFSGHRIDAVFFGRSEDAVGHALVVELKQWADASLQDEFSENILVGPAEHVHPSQQALDYASFLSDYHSAFSDGTLFARSCAFAHNLTSTSFATLSDPRFSALLADSPLFTGTSSQTLSAFVRAHVNAGDGIKVMDAVRRGRFKPSPKVIQRLEEVIKHDGRWVLLDNQRKAYNTILAHVRRVQQRGGRSAVLVRGGPGTGKTVIAVQLLSDALKAGFSAVHSTGGKAFTTIMRSKFPGADRLFIWNMATRNAPYQALDLLLVDEAHRIRETSDTRFTPKAQRGKKEQIDELLDAAKVSVFFMDENQFMRPDEVGESNLVREATGRLRIPLKEYDLTTQFRCGGCSEYLEWIDHLLGFRTAAPRPWGDQYRFDLADSPEDLDELMRDADSAGETARIVAGFCWRWSDPVDDGTLIDDVVIGDWRRPWNRKAEEKPYRPEKHPYTLWAETDAGKQQVGGIYSAQGFEFDRVGVIWGEDLIWREGSWVAQKAKSFDPPVKRNSEMLRLVRNAYRVLLTRGMRHTRLLCLDLETRAHVAQQFAALRETDPVTL